MSLCDLYNPLNPPFLKGTCIPIVFRQKYGVQVAMSEPAVRQYERNDQGLNNLISTIQGLKVKNTKNRNPKH